MSEQINQLDKTIPISLYTDALAEAEKKKIELNKENSNPKVIKLLKQVVNDNNYTDNGLVNTFAVFKSINDLFFLIYSNDKNYLVSFDLINLNTIEQIQNAHEKKITNINHCLDKNNHRDIIMSISSDDNNLKLWDASNWQCIINIKNVNKDGILFSGSFLEDKNQNLIITSNLNWRNNPEPIKIFDFNANKIKEIKNSGESTIFIDSYYDQNSSKNYIMASYKDYVKSYDYDNNKLYHKYCDEDMNKTIENPNPSHNNIIIINDENIIKLIESCTDFYIRIWNFHSGLLLIKTRACRGLNHICLFDNNYLAFGADFNLLNIRSGKTLDILKKDSYRGEKNVIDIKKITIPKYGECFITKGYNGDINLWVIDK